MNITEKILANACGHEKVQPGEIIESRVDLAMTHDGTSTPTIKTFNKISEEVWDPDKIVMVFDHNVPANIIGSAEFQRITRKFAKKHGITNIYTHGEGICHQVLPEKGYIKPGTVVVGADSHTCTYGAFGAFATGMGATDMAVVFATGKTWFMVPSAYKIHVEGAMGDYVTGKDIILDIIGSIGSYGATYKSLEFCGDTIQDMDVSGRMTICNMAVESGAKNGIMEPNDLTLKYLKERNVSGFQIFSSDRDAFYDKTYNFDVNDLEPQVACPHNVDNVYPVSKIEGKTIDQVFIGSCTNGRLEDLRMAAEVIDNHKVHPDTRLIVSPASRAIYLDAIHEGIIETMINAGAIVINPGCGPCLGAHMGAITAGEICLATTNRNFVGRMGDPNSEVYLSNPAVAAYSAIHGEIRNPNE